MRWHRTHALTGTKAAGGRGEPPRTRPLGPRIFSTRALVAELLWRIRAGALTTASAGVLLGNTLESALAEHLAVPMNRFAPEWLRDQFMTAYGYQAPEHRVAIAGATMVDLGSGADNPLAFSFLWLMLGARRAIAVEPSEVHDARRATRALADAAFHLLTNASRIVGEHAIEPAQVLRNISSFSLGALARGDAAGIDRDRLVQLRDEAERLTIRDAAADLVTSSSVLEHIAHPERAVAELARITKPGGLGVHNIDTADHRVYLDARRHPLELLADRDTAALVHGSNRWRIRQFLDAFTRHGFEVAHLHVYDRCDVPPDYARRYAPPFAAMPSETLGELRAVVVVRRAST